MMVAGAPVSLLSFRLQQPGMAGAACSLEQAGSPPSWVRVQTQASLHFWGPAFAGSEVLASAAWLLPAIGTGSQIKAGG